MKKLATIMRTAHGKIKIPDLAPKTTKLVQTNESPKLPGQNFSFIHPKRTRPLRESKPTFVCKSNHFVSRPSRKEPGSCLGSLLKQVQVLVRKAVNGKSLVPDLQKKHSRCSLIRHNMSRNKKTFKYL